MTPPPAETPTPATAPPLMAPVPLSERRLVAVSGKGGVGKTTVATAIALAFAEQGHKTLLAEINTGGAVPPIFGRHGHGHAITRLVDNLFTVNLSPESAVHEFALLVLRWESLYKLVLQNRFIKAFVEAVPALGAATMLGKLYYHGTPTGLFGGGEQFDRIVIDAPASGHAVPFFHTPRAMAQMVPEGAMRENTAVVAEFLARDSAFVLVTLPEEMPVTEALELSGAVDRELEFAGHYAVVNQCTQAVLGLSRDLAGLGPEAASTIERLRRGADTLHDPNARRLSHLGLNRIEALRREQQLIQRLRDSFDWPMTTVDRVLVPRLGPEHLLTMGRMLVGPFGLNPARAQKGTGDAAAA
jgi:hypothetical protein